MLVVFSCHICYVPHVKRTLIYLTFPVREICAKGTLYFCERYFLGI